MKNVFIKSIFFVVFVFSSLTSWSQTAKVPGVCKMFLDEKMIAEIKIEDAIKWSELTPPMVQCDDGKIYKLESFQISYLSLKPFQNQDFGIGEGGFPIMAQRAIKSGKAGDTIILKQATYTDANGTKNTLPTISLKLN